jgi:hypothetical protein
MVARLPEKPVKKTDPGPSSPPSANPIMMKQGLPTQAKPRETIGSGRNPGLTRLNILHIIHWQKGDRDENEPGLR